VALAAILALSGSAGSAQIQIYQTGSGDVPLLPGGAQRQLKTGTGIIRGRVLAMETGAALRRAQVRISGSEILPKTALTDGDGRFEFRDLPAGRFTMQATKSGFVTVSFGQTRPYESGRPIELADKQVLENSDIVMPRGSVIAGRIVDEFGEPVPDANVTAFRQTWSNGKRRLTPVGGRVAQTNDLGQFRLYGLPPGDYYVSASLRGGAEFMMMESMVAGFRTASSSTGPGPSASSPSSGYAPTYFPGTPNPSDAQRISLGPGQENSSADFALTAVRLSKVSGIVIGSDGKPASGAMVNLIPRQAADMILASHPTARTNQDGAFTLNNVTPGDYNLQANSLHVVTSSEGGNTMVFTMRSGPSGAATDPETGSIPVTVAGEDLPNIILVTAKGGKAAGKLTFEGGSKPPSLSSIRVSAVGTDDGPSISFGGGAGSGSVKDDGTFELTGLSGHKLIRVNGLPPGWVLKSVRYNGTDITDTGAEFRAGEAATGLEVVATSRGTTITGGVTGDNGSPLKDYTVVIFSDDEEMWRVPMSRWVTGSRPDQEGRFKVTNLPAGTYHAVAVEYIAQGEWGDPDLLARLKGKGRRFTLNEGGAENLDLKLAITY
jgi:protocatechuate 3,4-dioxygenase beta subunit